MEWFLKTKHVMAIRNIDRELSGLEENLVPQDDFATCIRSCTDNSDCDSGWKCRICNLPTDAPRPFKWDAPGGLKRCRRG